MARISTFLFLLSFVVCLFALPTRDIEECEALEEISLSDPISHPEHLTNTSEFDKHLTTIRKHCRSFHLYIRKNRLNMLINKLATQLERIPYLVNRLQRNIQDQWFYVYYLEMGVTGLIPHILQLRQHTLLILERGFYSLPTLERYYTNDTIWAEFKGLGYPLSERIHDFDKYTTLLIDGDAETSTVRHMRSNFHKMQILVNELSDYIARQVPRT